MTALFADLVGSTAFAERLDPEAVRAGLAPYFELLQSTIDDRAGTVVKFLGDGMFALFGIPEVAEDDALRAVAAGIDLQRRFRSFADDIRDRHGVELSLRVGINTGELVVGTDDVDLVGDVLNTAARLEAACQPGHVLVGEDTWRLTRSNVRYEVLGDVTVKGKTEPIATFQVVDHDDVGTDELTPFVGRSRELDVLRAVFDEAVASSSARMATVIGDPGVGKTRLAHQLRAGSEARSFDLRLERRGSTTFAPIADLLREVTGSGSAEEVARLLDGHPEAARLEPVLASFLGHGAPSTTEESFWAVRRLLELLAADASVIVVVDDIQWAEPLFWDLLDHLVEWTAAPVLLIALARPELRELRPELTQPGRRVSATIALEGLDPDTTLELAARLLGIDELPAELAERLPRSTEGNPLFVRELVQMLVDDGVLARDGDRWRLTIDADAIEVPPTILSLLASRVERLPDEERQVVELASVIGTEFDRGTLTAIAAGDGAARLGAVIDRLRRKDLIEPTGQWAGDHPVYRFHHVLIRDAAYRRLLKGHRAELHELVGRHVDTTGLAGDERDVIVAHHFEQVYQYRSDLGAVDDRTRDLAVEAATRLRLAAEQALGREDLASAGSAAIRALRLLGADAGAARDELLLIGCEALLSSADVTRSAPLVDELHTRSADARLAAWADCFRAQLWSLTATDRLTEAGQLAADAADRLAAIGDDAGVAKARLVRASCLARLGRVGDCEAELDLALGAARAAGDRRRTVAVLGAAPIAALWGPSPVARAGGRCLDVLRLLRITTASPTVEATSIRCQGMLEALRGRDDAARAKFETSRTMARELGLRHALYETELFAGLAELLGGEALAAEPHLRAAHAGLERLGIGADAGQAAALLARSLLLQGRVAEADELASTALDTAGQNLQTAIAARAVLAEVRAAQGRHQDARTLVDEALSIVAPTDVTLDHALTLLAAARVAVARGDAAASARHRERATELLAAKGATLAVHEQDPTGSIDAGPSSEPAPGPAPATRPIWNHALEMAHRSSELATAGDREGFLACYAPDFIIVDHGTNAASIGYEGSSDAESWADFAVWIMAQSPGSVVASDPIAIRGGRHALIRWSVRNPTADLERLAVLASDGVALESAHFYDPDHLVEAIDELDRQWTERDPSAVPYRTLAAGSRANAVMATGDPDAMRALVTADFVAVDHRLVGFGERSLDDWVASNDVSASGHKFHVTAIEILNGDDRSCLARIAASVGDATWQLVSIMKVRDGRISRIEHFDADDIDAALARYDELTRNDFRRHPFTNTAWEISELTADAFARRDAHALRELLTADFRAVWHERLAAAPLVADRDTFIDVLFDVDGNNDAVEHHHRLLATRGDHLALTWNRIDVAGAEQYVRYRVNESVGRQLISVEWFDDDQLDEAVAELDRRYLLSQGFTADHWIVTAWPRTYGTTAEEMQPVLHPDVEFVEHRRFHQLAGGGEELLRSADAQHGGTAMVTKVVRVTERGALYERVETEPGAPGELRTTVVLAFSDELVRHVEIFEADAFDDALARYDELTRGVPVGRELANTASRLAIALTDAQDEQDADRMAALLSPDFAIRAHGRWAEWFPQVSGPEFVTVIGTEVGQGARVIDVVAIRGEHLSLLRRTHQLASGLETDARLFLVASDDERIISIDWYQDGQDAEAFAELDRRYRQSTGVGDDHWLAQLWPTLYSADFDAMQPVFHATFEWVDCRRLSFPSGDAGVLQQAMSTYPTSPMVTIPAIHRLHEGGMVYRRTERFEVEDGQLAKIEFVLVLEFADDRLRRGLAYDPEDLDVVLAEFDARRREPRPAAMRGPAPNRAFLIADAFGQAAIRGDRVAMLELLADGFEIEHQGPARVTLGAALSGGTAEFVDRLLAVAAEERAASLTRVPIAIRGDDLYLAASTMTTVDGDEVLNYALGEADGAVMQRMTYFDESQLVDAYSDLDRRYRLACGIDDDHWIARHWDTLTSFDADRYDEILAPDFQTVGHRALSLGYTGREEMLEWLRATPASVTWSIPVIHRLSDRAMVLEHEETSADGSVEIRMLITIDLRGGVNRRVDVYDVSDLDAALARYDEITGASRDALSNGAWESARRRQEAQLRQDRAEFTALFDADFVAEFHDPRTTAVHGTAQFDKPGFLALVLHPDMTREGAGSEMELIAIRGDDLCLYRVGMISPDGDLTERLIVDATRAGRCTRMDIFDPDQVIDAQLELDRWYRNACGIGDDHWLAAAASTPYTTDFGDLGWFLHPDFEYVERRPLSWPSGDAAHLRDYMATYGEVPELIIPIVHRLSEDGIVYERLETADHALTDVVMVCHFQDERMRRLISYEPEDLERALAEFDAFVARRSSRTLTNRAWEIAEEAQRVRTSGDRDRFATFFAEDFVVTSHDSIMAQVTGGTHDKALWLDAAFDPSVFGPTSNQELELVAVRGDDHCLFRSRATTRSGDLHERLNVLEVRNGLAVHMEVFPHDQLSEAQLELDRRYRRSSGIGDDHWIAVNWHVLCATDFADIAPVLHRDFEFVERRRLAWPNGDAADWRKWLTPDHAALESTVPAIHRLSEHGVVTLRSERFEVGDLGVIDVVLVNEVEDGRVRRVISYAPEDLDRALAEFDEFVARREAGGPLTNAAWELAQGALSAHRDEDRVRFASLFAEAFVATARDTIMASVDAELIAVRGDDHCLFRLRTASADGDVNERIHLLEVRDGLGARWNSYPDDQLREAQIELDRQWLSALGFAEDHPWFELVGLFYDGESTTIARALSERLDYVDHRRLSFPDGGRSQLLANADTLFEAVEVVIPRYVRLTDRLALGHRVEQTVGGANQTPGLYVTRLGADGLIEHMEIFEVDDEAAAIACFDRLLAETHPAVRTPLTNRAWEITSGFNAAYVAGDRDAIDRLVDPDGPVEYRLRLSVVDSGTVNGFLDLVLASHAEASQNRQHLELVAVRGDHLCLVTVDGWYDDANLRFCLVVETDDERVTHMVWFDDDRLADAQIALDRRWVTSLGFPDDHPWFAVIDWFYESDPAVVARELSDGFRSIDHRRLTYPDGDSSQMIANMNTRLDAIEMVVPRYLRVTDRMALFEHVEQTVGGLEQSPSLMVSRLGPDGRVAHLEIFEVDDEAAAIDCFDRLLADAESEAAPAPPSLTNRAWEIAVAFAAAYTTGDREVLNRLVDPDGEVESRGRLNAFGTVSGQGFLDFRLAVSPAAGEGPRDLEIVAVRGEHHCLVLVDRWLHGDLQRLPIVVETDDERVTRMVWFDDDQLIDAQIELDRGWLEALGYADRWWEPIRLVMYDPHPDAMFEHLAPDFEYVDHRPLMFPSGDAEVLRSTIDSSQHDVIFTIPHIHRISDTGSVIERIETAVSEIGQTHVVFVSQFVDQRVQRMEAFDITQLDEALARYDELVGG